MGRDDGGNSRYLAGQRKLPGKPRREQPHRPQEHGTDGLASRFEQGPFFDLAVPAFPVGLVALLERRTGKPPDLELLAEWERIRAFGGYTGPVITTQLAAEAYLEDPEIERRDVPGLEPAPRRRGARGSGPGTVTLTARPIRAGGAPDPEDLGD